MKDREVQQRLLQKGYNRIERDDRLLDILPGQTREKGVELWERWTTSSVHITRLRLPYGTKEVEHFTIPRRTLEMKLQANQQLALNDYKLSRSRNESS